MSDPLAELEAAEVQLKKTPTTVCQFSVGNKVRLKDTAFDHVQWRILMMYTAGSIPMCQVEVWDKPGAHAWFKLEHIVLHVDATPPAAIKAVEVDPLLLLEDA